MFPLSNWTELDVWNYIKVENIPIVPLYFAKDREVIVRGNSLLMLEQPFVPMLPGEKPQMSGAGCARSAARRARARSDPTPTRSTRSSPS